LHDTASPREHDRQAVRSWSWRGWRPLACGVAALLAVAVYLNALHNLFVYDDHRVIIENVGIEEVFDLKAIVLQDISRPMVNVSYAVDRAIWGPEPFGFHLTNLILHALNVVLFFQLTCGLVEDWLARGVGRPLRAGLVATVAAAFFAVHPMMTEAVGYATGRTDLLCGTFFLLAFLTARRWLRGGHHAWLAMTFGLWLAALTSKETAAMLPFVILAYDRLVLKPDAKGRRRSLFLLHGPLLTATCAAGLARLFVLAMIEFHGDTVIRWRYALVELDVTRRYLGLMLIPEGQSIFHEVYLPSRTAIAVSLAIVGGGVLGVAWLKRRTQPLVTLGFLWMLLLLVPPALLVVMNHAEPMVERRMYMASSGLFLVEGIAVASIAARVSPRHRMLRRALIVLFGVSLASLSARTVLRNVVWGNPVALWREAADLAPNHWVPHLLLGEALHGTHRHDEAIEEYATAITLEPRVAFAYQKLALCLVETGRYDEAAATFEKLRTVAPDSNDVRIGLGGVALAAGQVAEAKKHLSDALAVDPSSVPARQALALLAETQTKDWKEALRWCQEIQELAPRTLGNDDCIRRNQARLAEY
jgi:tetratricopeptide (TPR) repeat protein